MKPKLLILTVLVAAVAVGVAYAVVTALRPPMPATWHQLRRGMVRSEVLSIVGTKTFDARDIKGFETTGVETSMAGMPSYWSIFLRYDTSERLTSADARFVNRVNGWFSTDELPVFP